MPIFLDPQKPQHASAPVANGEKENGHLCVSLTHSLFHSFTQTLICMFLHPPLSPLQCSVSCGVGRATRQVVCMNYNQQVDESFCHLDEKPSLEQECAAAPCHSAYQLWPNNHPYFPQDPRSHPGHSSWNVPSTDHQWRTGPWGSVCSLLFIRYYQSSSIFANDPTFYSTGLAFLFDEQSVWDDFPPS